MRVTRKDKIKFSVNIRSYGTSLRKHVSRNTILGLISNRAYNGTWSFCSTIEPTVPIFCY